MKSTKTLNIIVVLLVLINLSLLAFMWFNQPDKRTRLRARHSLEEELNFSPKQKDEFKALRELHFQEMQPLQKLAQDKRKELHELWQTGEALEAKAISEEIGEIHSKIELTTFLHFQAVRDICNQNQQLKFDKIIDQVLSRGEGPKPPRAPKDYPGERPPGPKPGRH